MKRYIVGLTGVLVVLTAMTVSGCLRFDSNLYYLPDTGEVSKTSLSGIPPNRIQKTGPYFHFWDRIPAGEYVFRLERDGKAYEGKFAYSGSEVLFRVNRKGELHSSDDRFIVIEQLKEVGSIKKR
jgi:hypothetical protein